MSARLFVALLLTGSMPLACSSSDDGRAPPSGGGGSSRAGASGAASEGGAGGAIEVAPAGATGDGGRASAGESNVGHWGGEGVSMAGAPAIEPAECDIAAKWGEPVPLPGVSTVDADEELLAMTHDELTIVFTRDDALLVADRVSVEQDFAAPVALSLPAGFTHEHGLALHPDGLGLIVVAELGDTFGELTRDSRSAAFSARAEVARFAAIAQNVTYTGGEVAGPVLSSDGGTFLFTRLKGGSSNVHRASGSPELLLREAPEDAVLSGIVGAYKLTQSLSADARTLFFYDEAEGQSAGAWSLAPGAPFVEVAAFSAQKSVFAAAGCARVYGTRERDASLDIVILSAD